VKGVCSMFFDLELGTIQGSILWLFPNVINMLPLFDIDDISSFAGINNIVKSNTNLESVKEDTKNSLYNKMVKRIRSESEPVKNRNLHLSQK
jgi:hypothetical protein